MQCSQGQVLGECALEPFGIFWDGREVTLKPRWGAASADALDASSAKDSSATAAEPRLGRGGEWQARLERPVSDHMAFIKW